MSAAPAVFFAFLTWMLVDEPVRGGMDVKVNGNHFGHQNRAALRGVGEESEEGGVAIGGERKRRRRRSRIRVAARIVVVVVVRETKTRTTSYRSSPSRILKSIRVKWTCKNSKDNCE